MIDIPVDDLVFIVCVLGGAGLLPIAWLARSRLDAAVGVWIGGIALVPLVLGFAAMLGVGGLLTTHLVDVHGAQAAIAGAGFGVVAIGIAYLLVGLRPPGPPGAPRPDA
jgi:hypothetical protein